MVERDERGEPTGIVRETAAWAFRDSYARPTLEELEDASDTGMRVANARGVTAIHDKDGWLGSFEVFQRLRDRGRLTLRVWQSFPADRLPHLAALGLRSGFGDELLRIGYLKAFMDGTLGSATARLLDGSGVWITGREQLEAIVRDGARAGFPVAVHAIGDAANRAALDALEATRDEWEPRGLLPRIEHAQLLHPDDVARFAQLGVAASVQFSHAPSDRDLADRVWEGHEGAYAYRSLLDAGTLLANGSDAPVEELDPLQGIRAGALRTLDERPPWRPEQRLSVAETLLASTVAPARLARDDDRRGTLVPGKLADLVVLDRDPLACSEAELAQIEVVATMLGGSLGARRAALRRCSRDWTPSARSSNASTSTIAPGSRARRCSSWAPPRSPVTDTSTSRRRGRSTRCCVLDDHTVAYLDLVGSGAETIAHLRENGRIVVMLCAFEGPPRILRLHGRGEVVPAGDARFDELLERCGFRQPPVAESRRSIIVVHVDRVADSCGYGVPLMSLRGRAPAPGEVVA